MNNTVTVYFALTASDDCNTSDEFAALKDIEEVLGRAVDNEGHDRFGDLVCKFICDTGSLHQLQREVEKLHGGGDDIIYLASGFEASGFEVVENPGLSTPIPFEDWDEVVS